MKHLPPLQYDVDTDTFRREGVPYKRVTNVLREALGDKYLFVDADELETAQQRGTAVHHCCEILNLGQALDWSAVDDDSRSEIEPYVAAYQQWRSDVSIEIVAAEQRLDSPEWQFTGQIDIVGMIRGKRVIIDIKTLKVVDRRVALQLGGYKHLFERNHRPSKVQQLFALYLWPHKSPPYKMVGVENPMQAERDFLTLINCVRVKERYGLKSS